MSTQSSSSNPSSSSSNGTALTASFERKLKRVRETTDEICAKQAVLQQQIKELASEVDSIDATRREQLSKEFLDLEEFKKQVEQEQTEWQQTQAKIRKVSPAAPRRVTLNVGGTPYVTSLETLTNEKGTYFAVMFSDHFPSPADEKGEVFIDRPSRHFELVLNHMRGIDVSKSVKELSVADRALLEQEVDFYQIESLKQLLRMGKYALCLHIENVKRS